MAQSRLRPRRDDSGDPRQLPLPGLFSSDARDVFFVGNLDLALVDAPQGFGRIRTIKRRVNQIAATWDIRVCDPIRVMWDPVTGRYMLVDGAHRFEAAKKNAVKSLPARVERTMTIPEAADIFVKRAVSVRSISQADKFRNDVVAGHTDALEVRDILEAFGLYAFVDADRTAAARIHLMAIAAVRRVHTRLGNPELREILSCIDAAWRLNAAGSLNAEVLAGAGEFWARYHDKFDRPGLIEHLRKIDPVTLKSQADQLRGASRPRMSARVAISQILKDLYNYGRKNGGRLD